MINEELIIEGMSCSHCVAAVEKLLSDVEGVESFKVNLPDTAKVLLDESKINLVDLKKIINNSELYKTI